MAQSRSVVAYETAAPPARRLDGWLMEELVKARKSSAVLPNNRNMELRG